ncbi:hypothetical protein NCC49_000790 [Naganishia albida]|nr:hypothetical protein NCC49_000790 [Naganishia albida]
MTAILAPPAAPNSSTPSTHRRRVGFQSLPVEIIEIILDQLVHGNGREGTASEREAAEREAGDGVRRRGNEERFGPLAVMAQTCRLAHRVARPALYSVMGWRFRPGRQEDMWWKTFLRSPQRQYAQFLYINEEEDPSWVFAEFGRMERRLRGSIPNTLVGTISAREDDFAVHMWDTSGLDR